MAFLDGPWKPNVKLDDLVIKYTQQYFLRTKESLEKEIEDAEEGLREDFSSSRAKWRLFDCKKRMRAFNGSQHVADKSLHYFFQRLNATQIFEKWKKMEEMQDDDITDIHFRERCMFIDNGFCFVLEVMNVELNVRERHELTKYIINNILKIERPKTGSSQDCFAAMDTLWYGFFTDFQNAERDRLNDNGKRDRDDDPAQHIDYTLDGFQGRLRATLQAYLVKRVFFARSHKKIKITQELEKASNDPWKWFNSQENIVQMKKVWKDLIDTYDPHNPDFHYSMLNRLDFCTGFFFMFEVIGKAVMVEEKQKFLEFLDRDLSPYYPGPQYGANETKMYAKLDQMWDDFSKELTRGKVLIGIQNNILLQMKL